MESLASSADVDRGFLESDVNQVCSKYLLPIKSLYGKKILQKKEFFE